MGTASTKKRGGRGPIPAIIRIRKQRGIHAGRRDRVVDDSAQFAAIRESPIGGVSKGAEVERITILQRAGPISRGRNSAACSIGGLTHTTFLPAQSIDIIRNSTVAVIGGER